MTEAMVNGKTVVEYSPESTVSHEIKRLWETLLHV
jgi:MinD-like ATPase involved in chromosome partitioning or flagellar assembly